MNKEGYFEMRIESIGGLGANLCGKLLGELGATKLGLHASAFAEYGSEKRGSPVKAFVRWCKPPQEILRNSPVERPHVLAVFHDALIHSAPVCTGVEPDCHIVVNTDDSLATTRKRLRLHAGTVHTLDASDIAKRTKSRVNTVMFGAICKATGLVSEDVLLSFLEEFFSKKFPETVQNTLAGAKIGYSESAVETFAPSPLYPPIPFRESKSKWGYQNAPLGGVNPHFGSTVSNDLSASREGFIPLFHPEKCIHCGLCDSTCPDMVFQFLPGEYKGKERLCNRGLDYHHCKGCLRCVQACPTGALTVGVERKDKMHVLHHRNKDLIVEKLDFENTGADASVTGESYDNRG